MNEPLVEDTLKRLIQSSLDKYSGTDQENIYGVPAASMRRRSMICKVLGVARDIIAEEGMAALTFRRISNRCKITVSNLQYYFPSSEDIVRSLIRFVLTEYLTTLLNGSFLEISDHEQRLRAFLEVQIADVQKKRTNAIFMALWDMAQRDTFVSEWLGEIYSVERSIIMSMLGAIHPLESQREIYDRSAVIASLIEGLMPLFGPATQPASEFGNVHGAAIRFACLIAGIDDSKSLN